MRFNDIAIFFIINEFVWGFFFEGGEIGFFIKRKVFPYLNEKFHKKSSELTEFQFREIIYFFIFNLN